MSDVWAVGCLGYELCTGQRLPHTIGLEVTDIQSEEYGHMIDLSEIPPRFGSTINHIIKRCLEWEPSRRWTAENVVQFIRDYTCEDTHLLETTRIFMRPYDNAMVPNPQISLDGRPIQTGMEAAEPPFEPRMSGDSTSNSTGSASTESNTRSPVSQDSSIAAMTISSDQVQNASWTTGGHEHVKHLSIIDTGGTGEVHKVYPLSNFQLTSQMWNAKTQKVVSR